MAVEWEEMAGEELDCEKKTSQCAAEAERLL
jgi:hypothetical protein